MPRVAQTEIDRRRRDMTELLRQRAYLPVGELCRKFSISEATARRDLAALSRGKSIVRTFGGAMADYDRRFAPFADRLIVAASEKARIAAAAVRRIAPGMTVFLDAGTTLYAVADLLARRPLPLRVVTNSLAVSERLAPCKAIEVDLLGGRLLANQSVLLGPLTCRAAGFYRFDLALLGAEGFDQRGVWNSTGDVVALQQAVVRQSEHHAVCADGRKLGVSAPTFLLPWDAVDVLITDAHVPAEIEISPAQIINA
jgi:DeoR family fructose operon transcriptional repressor